MNPTKQLSGVCSECGGSIQFPAELVGTTAQCPRCCKQTELLLPAPPEEPAMSRNMFVCVVVALVMLALAVIVPLVGLKHFEKVAGFEVSAISLEKGAENAGTFAVGTVVNKAARKRSGVTVELDLLDAGGQKVGVARGYRPALEPGAKWDLRVPVGEAKAVSAKLASIKEGQ
jgi:hypothetical protein